MTNMELIEQIVREGGVHYGRTVEQNPEKYGAAQTAKARKQRKCKICGELFIPDILADGTWSKKQKCRNCIDRLHRSKEEAAERRAAKRRKVYIRVCGKCGAEVETTQAPRGSVPIFCVECRKKRKKGDGMVKYKGVKI